MEMGKKIFLRLLLVGVCVFLQGCGGMFVQKTYVSSDVPLIANVARDAYMGAMDKLCNNKEPKYRQAHVGGGALGVKTSYEQICATK